MDLAGLAKHLNQGLAVGSDLGERHLHVAGDAPVTAQSGIPRDGASCLRPFRRRPSCSSHPPLCYRSRCRRVGCGLRGQIGGIADHLPEIGGQLLTDLYEFAHALSHGIELLLGLVAGGRGRNVVEFFSGGLDDLARVLREISERLGCRRA